ncbi:copper-binding protein [Vibrio breoganii]|nr:copper-binding protein [Vibrio breoganii]PMI24245.1 copper-binding protein [Vibrio breoganii]
MKKLTLLVIAALTTGVAVANAEDNHMNHGKQDHANMDHSKMDHSKMDHSGMSMDGMNAVGMPAKGAKPDKVIHVMLDDDMSITFKRDIAIEPDDVVQFVVLNKGKLEHEFVIGSHDDQKTHREMMKSMGSHDMSNSVAVAPGKAKQILWHFHGESTVELACNMPGHYEAGMVKTLELK